MTRICFIDNDIILKLTAFQLFEEAITTLQVSKTDVRVLATAKYVFRKNQQKKLKYTDAVWAGAIALVETLTAIQDPDVDETEAIVEEAAQLETFRNEIHPGEAALILSTREVPIFILLTGDKNCLSVLPKISGSVYQRLCGRVICLEQVILRLIRELGFKSVRDRVMPEVDCDMSLKFCFGYSEPVSEEVAIENLVNTIEALRQNAPGLLSDW